MKAMVLAAGLGTRLRPLTDHRPKALVEIGRRTLLQISLERLRSFGIHEVIINVHHFADMIIDYLCSNNYFGMTIEISREDVLLDTGGGLKKAAYFFKDDFLLHNVDVISTIDLEQMAEFHRKNTALATLAVQKRTTSRYLLFDTQGLLCGRRSTADQKIELIRPSKNFDALAFSGIHVISPRLLDNLTEEGVFSIITSYLRLAGAGERIVAFHADNYRWRDLGKPADLMQAAQELSE